MGVCRNTGALVSECNEEMENIKIEYGKRKMENGK